jgi:tyrosyl-tRNA synthetase
LHPRDVKVRLATEVISDFHGPEAAEKAAENFQRVYSERQAPTEMPVVRMQQGEIRQLNSLLVELKLVASKSEADRLIKQGGVEVDGVRANDPRMVMPTYTPGEFTLRVGKKTFLKVVVE